MSTDSTRASERRAVCSALLDFHLTPGRYPVALREPRPVFEHLHEVLALAAGRSVEGLVWDADLEARVRQAARFFVRSVMLRPGADHYTLLGVAPGCEAEVLREHYRLMIRMTHPDFLASGESWPPDAAARINIANDVLSSPEKREAYNATLAATRHTDSAGTLVRSLTSPGTLPRHVPAMAADARSRGRHGAGRRWPTGLGPYASAAMALLAVVGWLWMWPSSEDASLSVVRPSPVALTAALPSAPPADPPAALPSSSPSSLPAALPAALPADLSAGLSADLSADLPAAMPDPASTAQTPPPAQQAPARPPAAGEPSSLVAQAPPVALARPAKIAGLATRLSTPPARPAVETLPVQDRVPAGSRPEAVVATASVVGGKVASDEGSREVGRGVRLALDSTMQLPPVEDRPAAAVNAAMPVPVPAVQVAAAVPTSGSERPVSATPPGGPARVIHMGQVQPVLSNVTQSLQSGRAEDALQWIERSARNDEFSAQFVRKYHQTLAGSRVTGLGQVRFTPRFAAEQLVVDGVVQLRLQDAQQQATVKDFHMRAYFRSQDSGPVLARLVAE